MVAALSALLSGCAIAHAMYDAGVDVDCRGGRSHTTGGTVSGPDGLGVAWFRSAGRRDQELASAWCETVGSAVVTPNPSNGVLASSPEDTIAVVTWNINVGGGDLLSFLDTEFRLRCGSSELVSGEAVVPFVLLLQEAYRRSDQIPIVSASAAIPWTIDPDERPGEHLDIVELADRCGLSLVYVPSARNGPDTGARPREDKGNAILSSLPLSAPVAIDLPFEAGRKVAVAANIRIRGRPAIRVVSVHLDAVAPLIRTLLTGNQTRARQALGLIEALDLLEGRLPGVSATVVGADLNTWAPDETAALLMRRAFPQSPPWDGRTTRGPFPTDHLFFRSGGDGPHLSDYRVVESNYHSDHRARIVLLHR